MELICASGISHQVAYSSGIFGHRRPWGPLHPTALQVPFSQIPSLGHNTSAAMSQWAGHRGVSLAARSGQSSQGGLSHAKLLQQLERSARILALMPRRYHHFGCRGSGRILLRAAKGNGCRPDTFWLVLRDVSCGVPYHPRWAPDSQNKKQLEHAACIVLAGIRTLTAVE